MVEMTKKLLKSKVDRLVKEGDRSILDFLNIVFICDGTIKADSSAFFYYEAEWGQERFNEAKEFLIKTEAILKETGGELKINHPEPQSTAQYLSHYFFQKRFDHFKTVINSIMSSMEGRYFLQKLIKNGPSINEETLNSIKEQIGDRHYHQIFDDLTKNCLLVWFGSSNKHEYYKIFPQICNLLTLNNETQKALTFIYIAQGIREKGVLESDCTDINEYLLSLKLISAIEENYWYRLCVLKTTSYGSEIASKIVSERLKNAKSDIEEVLKKLPKRLMRYLIEHICLSENDMGRSLLPPYGDHFVCRDGYAFCLLNDKRIKDKRDQLLNKFKDFGLVEVVHSYVSSKGGRVDDETYVLAPELKDFLTDYLRLHNFDEPLFPAEIDGLVKIYDIFMSSVDSQNIYKRDIPGQYGSLAKRAVDDLIEKGILSDEKDIFRISNRETYKQLLDNLFLRPVVDYLYHQPYKEEIIKLVRNEFKEEKQIKESIKSPDGTFKVRAKYKGEMYHADFKGGKILFNGEWLAPSTAAGRVTGGSVNGWIFWEYYDEKTDEWKFIDELRRKPITYSKIKRNKEERYTSIQHGSLKVYLGRDENDSDVFWSPGKLNNGHFIIVGGSGAGKTETIRCIALELNKQSFPVLMIDFHGDMAPGTENCKIQTYEIKEKGDYYFNPLELNETFKEITPLRATSDFVDAISINFPNLGNQQKHKLREIIRSAYNDLGISNDPRTWSTELSFEIIENKIKSSEDKTTQSVKAYLDDLFEYKLFSSKNKISINNILDTPIITHLNLRMLPESLRSLYADLLLRKIYYSLQALGEIPRGNIEDKEKFRIFVIVDEAKLLVSENQGIKAVLNKYATELRKFGVGLILASQLIDHFNEEILSNIAVKLCMKAETEKQAKINSKFFGSNEKTFISLNRGEGIFIVDNKRIKIKIIPTWERSR